LKWLHVFESQPAMKKPRAKQRGTSNKFEVFRVSDLRPSCLAGYFPWPQVALTHHAFPRCLYAPKPTSVKNTAEHSGMCREETPVGAAPTVTFPMARNYALSSARPYDPNSAIEYGVSIVGHAASRVSCFFCHDDCRFQNDRIE
jgi:hypothetical protein